jgi:hypothetical protein
MSIIAKWRNCLTAMPSNNPGPGEDESLLQKYSFALLLSILASEYATFAPDDESILVHFNTRLIVRNTGSAFQKLADHLWPGERVSILPLWHIIIVCRSSSFQWFHLYAGKSHSVTNTSLFPSASLTLQSLRLPHPRGQGGFLLELTKIPL